MIITELHIIDYYDDIITSIISINKDRFILNCIKKNFINGVKTYYCVKIDEEYFKQIVAIIDKKRISKKDWSTINVIFKENNKNDNVFLLEIESLIVGSNVTLKKASSLSVIDIMFPFDISDLYQT
ncbi:hypothetical protein NAL32_19805 [Chryseobacterium sp. Ch-15]|uniref:Uncharacterized protein n=1 Tax=Chryseobacterium muglaense TaxID=2893752 RepID=A0A9Q3UZX3_9FLAO|nr:hypothetical protein [Chryseobacterium muglaense]MBD3906423.1 hypothetical protein [Chryseobacterium muglaense]MCC9037068.1 hypothetical protein [Chryseobacterium muglaense]MCM2556641.1 hypothetical protein [Chryseobacterium muglaense]